MENKGERLKKLRKALNLKQYEMASDLGITNVSLSYFENNTRDITNQLAKSICNTYNVNPVWLNTGEGNMFKQKEESNQTNDLHAFVDKAIEDNSEMLQVLNLLNQIQNKQSE